MNLMTTCKVGSTAAAILQEEAESPNGQVHAHIVRMVESNSVLSSCPLLEHCLSPVSLKERSLATESL